MTKIKKSGIVIGVLWVVASVVVAVADITLPENKKSDTAQKSECESKAPVANRKVFAGNAVTTSTLTQRESIRPGQQAAVEKTVEYRIPCLAIHDKENVGRMTGMTMKFTKSQDDKPLQVTITKAPSKECSHTVFSSVWLAAVTAAMQRNDLMRGNIISVEIPDDADKDSTCGTACLAILSAMDEQPLRKDFVMIGTVLPDGTIGTVSGTPEKMQTVAKAGIRRIFIPSFLQIARDAKKEEVNLNRLADELKIELCRVENIAEAYAILHNKPYHQDGCEIGWSAEDSHSKTVLRTDADDYALSEFLRKRNQISPQLNSAERFAEVERFFFSAACAAWSAADQDVVHAAVTVKDVNVRQKYMHYCQALRQTDSAGKTNRSAKLLNTALKGHVRSLAFISSHRIYSNGDSFQHLCRIARKTAIRNINECMKAGIPCLPAIRYFEQAEASRDSDKIPDYRTFAYWQASLYAKAMLMSFRQEKDFAARRTVKIIYESKQHGKAIRRITYDLKKGKIIFEDMFNDNSTENICHEIMEKDTWKFLVSLEDFYLEAEKWQKENPEHKKTKNPNWFIRIFFADGSKTEISSDEDFPKEFDCLATGEITVKVFDFLTKRVGPVRSKWETFEL